MHPSLRLRCYRLHVPDAFRILLNASVTAEEAHTTDAGDTLGDPFILVLVRLVDKGVSLDVAVKVVTDQIVVAMVNDRVD